MRVGCDEVSVAASLVGCFTNARRDERHLADADLLGLGFGLGLAQALAANEFRGADFDCDPSDLVCFDGNEWLERLNFENVEVSSTPPDRETLRAL